MAASDPKEIAARVRARIAEMGESESSLAEKSGRHRSVFSTQLRNLEQGGNVRSDTLATFEKVIGKSQQWILTGEESEGIRLDTLDAWTAVRAEAAARYKLPPEALDAVGKMRVPEMPKRFDAAFVGALARGWADAT